MQTLKGGMVRARTSLAAVGPGTFATVQEPFLVWLAPHQAPHSPTWGIQQRDWESPGNLTLKVSGTWLQSFHRTGENRDSWRAPAHLVHPAPRAKEQRPHPRLSRPACEGLGVSCGRVGPQRPTLGSELWQQQSWEVQCVGISPLGGGPPWHYHRASRWAIHKREILPSWGRAVTK